MWVVAWTASLSLMLWVGCAGDGREPDPARGVDTAAWDNEAGADSDHRGDDGASGMSGSDHRADDEASGASSSEPSGEGPDDEAPDAGTANTSAEQSEAEAGETDSTTPSCISTKLGLKPIASAIPIVMLVLDRSSSMQESGQWQQLTQVLRRITQSLDGVVDFGLMLFPSPRAGFFNVCAPGEVIVEPQPRAAGAIATALGTPPLGGTPTADSLAAAREALALHAAYGNAFVLLATDGGPGCNAALNPATCTCIPGAICGIPANCLDDQRTLAMVQQLRDSGIRTYVIGIPGTEEVVDLLDEMAVLGGTDINGQHYSVANSVELEAALRATAGGHAPCSYVLSDLPDDSDTMVVTIDNMVVSRDPAHQDGWDVDEAGHAISFYGTACETLRDGQAHDVSVMYDC